MALWGLICVSPRVAKVLDFVSVLGFFKLYKCTRMDSKTWTKNSKFLTKLTLCTIWVNS